MSPIRVGVRPGFFYLDDQHRGWLLGGIEFISDGNVLAERTEIPQECHARIRFLNRELFDSTHAHRIRVGTEFSLQYGPDRLFVGVVTKRFAPL